MVKHNIDIASFRCECGHRSTPPSEVNTICYQMDFYKVVEEVKPDGGDPLQPVKAKLSTIEEQKIKADTEREYKGNTVNIVQEANQKVAKFTRSYCTIKLKSAAMLEESDHIILGCPNCGKTLYEVKY